jgi:osmotically-inducible protein OsmY
MAENNRNQGSENRFTSQEWDNDYNRQQRNWEDRYNQGNQGWQDQNQGYSGSSGRSNRMSDEGNYGSRWNRDSGNRGNESSWGRQGGDYSSGNYGNQDRNYGYGGREYGSQYGGGNYMGNSSYYDSGSYGNSGRSSYGNSRNLYDRDYERFDRGFNSGYSGLGAGDYGRGYESRGRRSYDENPYYGGTNYRNYYGRNQGYGRGDANDRSWWDRTKDEVSSWFGDEDAERRRERDERMNFRGRGPKNYTRSDDRIKEDINDRLSDDPWVDASEVDVTVNSGDVTLTGTVNERSDKRRAEDLAEAVSGVKNVENRIRVGKREGTTGTMAGGSYTSAETAASQTGTTGTGATTTDKNKSKTSYVTG